ncbi:hypothetical protein THAOC_09180 [Thalassiosira oceanica]|uniref:Nucleotide-diphospho-sugar transferase domain-containing protein n=1 Tax=Thalassiosira oceanica TaxID=159749 RepID=K0ST37_THAOC|nr:hypothetical protein THAOC_09180 [Thalassiosira oceanica]|eukprot:EJK69548.1 hypothetical protein THAOC_09180 [Thalassiosira oceanica]
MAGSSCLDQFFAALILIAVVSIADTTNRISEVIGVSSPVSTRRHRRAHIVLVENRELPPSTYGFHTWSMWQFYQKLHPQVSVLAYNSSDLCNGTNKKQPCIGHGGLEVAPYWMKVLAMLNAADDTNENDLLVFMDTVSHLASLCTYHVRYDLPPTQDMQILNENFTKNIFDVSEFNRFFESEKSFLVIEEFSDSWWGEKLKRENAYSDPIVSNFFAVINDETGKRMLLQWWESMGQRTPMDKTGEEMLVGWPWEQERLAAYYNASPHLFFAVNQSWHYMDWLHHGPLCCVGFTQKHDIIRSVEVTLTNQTKRLRNETRSYEEVSAELFADLNIRPLSRNFTILSDTEEGFWNKWL